MKQIIDQFFAAYRECYPMSTVFTSKTPKEMMASPVDNEGWFEWKLIPGTLQHEDFESVEREYNVIFPRSFIEWHKAYFFLDGDCSLARLPHSNPVEPLKEIRNRLYWYIPKQLIPQKLYPFAEAGDDACHFVFDGRFPAEHDEFPIRIYDQDFGGDLSGLSEIIFSTFSKLLECLTHFMRERKSRKEYEIVLDFFAIDPQGAGKTGVDYWLAWSRTLRATAGENDS